MIPTISFDQRAHRRPIAWGVISAAGLMLSGLTFSATTAASAPSDMDGAQTPNGKVVVDYIDLAWNQGSMAAADKAYYSPDIVRHTWLGMRELAGPGAPNSSAPSAPPPPPPADAKTHMDILKVVVQGDLVFVQGHGTRGPGNGELFWFLCRVKDGKIVERWDTHNPIPDSQVGKQW